MLKIIYVIFKFIFSLAFVDFSIYEIYLYALNTIGDFGNVQPIFGLLVLGAEKIKKNKLRTKVLGTC